MMVRCLKTLLLLFVVVRAEAQVQPPEARPSLPAGRDRNDWEAYFDLGVSLLRKDTRKAEAAFHWSSRLAPDRSEPLYAQYIAFHAADNRRYRQWREGVPKVMARPDVQHADSMLTLSMYRNPFTYRSLLVLLYEALGNDELSRAWTAYATPDPQRAVRLFGALIAREPKLMLWQRYPRAEAFVALAQYDSALAEIAALRAGLTGAAQERETLRYESKAMIEYAMGLLEDALRRPDRARAAMERALLEDVSFWPAHQFLALQSIQRNRVAEALPEFELARLAAPDDPVLLLQHGRALLTAGRLSEATDLARRLVVHEPYWATGWVLLGQVEEKGGALVAARAAYDAAVLHAAKYDAAGQAAGAALARLGGTARP